MIGAIKKIIVNILSAINVIVGGLLLLSGYGDRINPVDHELLACAGMLLPVMALLNVAFIPVWVFFAWRRLWIPVAFFALAYVPIRIYMPLNGRSEPPEGAIRIVSWNVCGFGGNHKYDHALDSVLNYVVREQADIVCLQEDMNKPNILEAFAQVFPYNDTTRISKPSYPMVNAVGLHSRFPILRKEPIDYDSEVNGSVAYYLLIGRDTVLLINNHLESTHLSINDRERYNQLIKGHMARDTVQAETKTLFKILGKSMAMRASHAEAIHDYIEQHRQYPTIVCGDFNDTPVSYARHTIAKGLTDCYVETGRGPGISFNKKEFSFRIDHLLVSEHFTPYGCKIDSENDVSDHYPLLCWLKIADNP